MNDHKFEKRYRSLVGMKEMNDSLEKIKAEIRKWYGIISVKELICNKALIVEIEKIERLLSRQVVA